MPMERARCPECGSPVGGEHHRPVAGVTRAEQMEADQCVSMWRPYMMCSWEYTEALNLIGLQRSQGGTARCLAHCPFWRSRFSSYSCHWFLTKFTPHVVDPKRPVERGRWTMFIHLINTPGRHCTDTIFLHIHVVVCCCVRGVLHLANLANSVDADVMTWFARYLLNQTSWFFFKFKGLLSPHGPKLKDIHG